MKLGELIIVGDDWYKLFRTIKDDRQWDVELLKNYWHCTHAFKKDEILYFCREIPKAELVL
jgi:hypothetical protein